MSLWDRVLTHYREKGVRKTFVVIFYRLLDYYFDLKYHTDTTNSISLIDLIITSKNKERGYAYQPTMALPFNRLMDKVSLPADPVLIDFGCGKGRVLMLAALREIRKSVGIEFSPELCNAAKQNIKTLEKYLGRKLDITVIESDVTDYKIEDDQNVFFFANPFDEVILNEVAQNILKSLKKHQRKILTIYYNPIHADIFARYFRLKEKHIIATEEYLVYANN